MIEVFSILRWPLLVLCGGFLVYWVLVLTRIVRALRAAPMVRHGLKAAIPADGWPPVSVIVPAHNEAAVIEQCVRGLAGQDYPSLHMVFVLDRCTDDTLARLHMAAAQDPRVTVVENDSCPPDWSGKCYAARIGSEHATGDWLLFTDADTRFDPSLVRAAMGMAISRDLEFLSLLSTLTTTHRFERLVQPVASMTLMRMYPIDLVNRADSNRCFANGQFMLFSRDLYRRVGGHSSVRHDLLEDMSFARHVCRKSGRSGVFPDGGMLECAMYDSFVAFREGWKRIYIEACKRKPDRLRRIGTRIAAAAVIEPIMRLAAFVAAAWHGISGSWAWATILGGAALAGFIAKTGALAWVYRLGGAPVCAVLAHSMGSWHVARIMWEGARDLDARRPVRWGGREYVLQPRKHGAPRDFERDGQEARRQAAS